MRTALCLYGQPRNFSINWPNLENTIVNNSDVDVFFHTWYDEDDLRIKKMTPGHENRTLESNLRNVLPSVTKAKKYKIEKQIDFSNKIVKVTDENIESCWSYSTVYDRETFIRNRVFSHYSMWYSINQSIMQKEIFAQENKIEYDCVILSRFDTSPSIRILPGNYDLNKVTSGYKELPRNEINDWFLLTNNKNINIVGSLFLLIDYYRDLINENDGIWTNESYLRDQLKKFNIEVDFKEEINLRFS